MRFPNFNDEWTQCYYKDIFDIIVEKNNNLEFENVVSASLIYGVISRNELGVDIKYSSESIRGYKIVRDGDYIIHLRSFQGGFAFSRLNGICSPAYTILRPKPLYISYGFFEKYFTSSRFINSLKLVTYGIRDGRSIAVDEWMQEVGSLPTLAEQKKIADFFSLIDERITNLSETIKERKREKAGLLNQLFSQKLRFPDFNDEWTPFFVGDIAKLGRGRVISNKEIQIQLKPLYPVYSSQTLNNGVMGYLDTFDFEGEYITWTTDGANAGTVFYRSGKFNCTNVCGILKLKSEFSHLFCALGLQKETKKFVSTNLANPKLMNNTMAKISLSLPSLAEQKKIANFLSLIDERIEVEEQLLQQYEKQKRYLLRQMFV